MTVTQDPAIGLCGQKIHPTLHARVMTHHQTRVAVMLMEQHRNKEVGDAHGVGRSVPPVERGRVGDGARPRILGVRNVIHKLLEKSDRLEVVN